MARTRIGVAVAGVLLTVLGCVGLLVSAPLAIGAWVGDWELVRPFTVYAVLSVAVAALGLAIWFLFALYRPGDTR